MFTQAIRNYSVLPLKELTVLVGDTFHANLRDSLEVILTQIKSSDKVEDAHDSETSKQVEELRNFFSAHIEKEKRLLFPAVTGKSGRLSNSDGKAFVLQLKKEHEMLKDVFARIRKATHNYNCEPNDAPSRKLAYSRLHDFEQDVFHLVFIEEEYLFPRFLALNRNNS